MKNLRKDLNRLRNVLNTMSPRDKQMMCDRFGISFHLPKTLQEVGDSNNFISRERVRQVEVVFLKELNNIK